MTGAQLGDFFTNRDGCYFSSQQIEQLNNMNQYEERRANKMHDNMEHRLLDGPHLSRAELRTLKRMRAERIVRNQIARLALTGELPDAGYHPPHL